MGEKQDNTLTYGLYIPGGGGEGGVPHCRRAYILVGKRNMDFDMGVVLHQGPIWEPFHVIHGKVPTRGTP